MDAVSTRDRVDWLAVGMGGQEHHGARCGWGWSVSFMGFWVVHIIGSYHGALLGHP